MDAQGTNDPASDLAQTQVRLLLECVTDYAIFSLDAEGHVLTWNIGAQRIFGYTEAEIIGQHFSSFFTVEDVQQGVPGKELQTAAQTGRANDDRWLVRKDGERLWCNGVTTALRDTDGRLRGFAKMLRDRTEWKALQEALRQRAEELAEEARRKDELLAVLAHELRNPLAPIRNALQALRRGGQDPTTSNQLLTMAERQLVHLTCLVSDLFDLARTSRGLLQLHKHAVNVSEPVRQAVEGVQPAAQERGLSLSVSLPEPPIRVKADPTRLRQVVDNLLTNAVKYTDPGGQIQLTVCREGEEMVLCVRDTGIGIAPEMLPRIFDLFVQAERRLDRSQGGLGIGLTLVRRLVEMHGGSVQAYSEGQGKGSEFVVRLPALPVDPAAEPPPLAPTEEKPRLAACRILIVDDNVDAADSLSILLHLEGHQTRVAYDGPSAVAAAQAELPDVAILDLGMPGMDGFEVAQRFRELPGGKDILLVALTGWTQEEDRRRCSKAGFDGHLPKPVELEALHEFLAHPKLLRHSSSR